MKKVVSIILIVFLLNSTFVFAHSGGTNSDGCHNDNINGGYHCHNGSSSSSDSESEHSEELLWAAVALGAIGLIALMVKAKNSNHYSWLSDDVLFDRSDSNFKVVPLYDDECSCAKVQMVYEF